jgi:hypothetical protein
MEAVELECRGRDGKDSCMETRYEARHGERISSTGKHDLSYAEALKEVGISTKDVIQSELALIKAEFQYETRRAGRHVTQIAIFGGLVALSVLPLIAFLVIGLGNLMGGRYALSSLIVALVFAIVGGAMAYRAYKQLKEEDLKFSRTRKSLDLEAGVVQAKVDDVKNAANPKGARYESHRLH